MAIPIYTLGYPPDGSSLGQTKTTIRNNLDGTFLTLGGDHVNNNGQPGSIPQDIIRLSMKLLNRLFLPLRVIIRFLQVSPAR